MAKHLNSEDSRKEKTINKKNKKGYLKPELIIYGHIEKLTEGSGGSRGESMGTRRPRA